MKVHTLKTIQPYYDAVVKGYKTFEYRLNDRKFEVGDVLHLKEYNSITKRLTGDESFYLVKYIVQEVFSLPTNYCIMGIEKIEESK